MGLLIFFIVIVLLPCIVDYVLMPALGHIHRLMRHVMIGSVMTDGAVTQTLIISRLSQAANDEL